MRFVAHRMPLYYIYGPKPADQMPAFLLTHGGQVYAPSPTEPPIAESEMMAAALTQAGLSVETLWLPDAGPNDVFSGTAAFPRRSPRPSIPGPRGCSQATDQPVHTIGCVEGPTRSDELV